MKWMRWGTLLLMMMLSMVGVRAQDTDADDFFDSWSPDGQSVLFTSGRNGASDLYIVKRDGTDLQQLTQGQTVNSVFFSPDSRSLILTRYDNDTGGLYLLTLADKSQTLLLENNESYYDVWSPDSRHVLVVYGTANPDNLYNVVLLDTATGDARNMTENGMISPEFGWSADGSLFYVGGTVTDADTGIVLPQLIVYHADGTAASENLLASYWNNLTGCCYMQVAFSPDNTHLAVSISQDGTIFDINLSDVRLKPVGYAGGQVLLPVWSPDGTELRYRLFNGHYDYPPLPSSGKQPGFYRLNLVDGQAQPEPIALNDQNFIVPSPDGSQIALFPYPNRSAAFAMQLMMSVDADPVDTELTYTNTRNIDWSPDGTAIAASLCVGGDYDVYVFDVATGQITNVSGDDTTIDETRPTCGGYG